MKRLLVSMIVVLVVMSSGVLYSSKLSSYHVVDIYVCEEGVVLAEMIAQTEVNRRELTTVSFCTCEGVDPSFITGVKKTERVTCIPPKNQVYSCICIGKAGY